LRLRKEAERDAVAILRWLLQQHAGETGIYWFLGLEAAVASLAEHPERCPWLPKTMHSLLKCGSFFMAEGPMFTAFCSLSKDAWCMYCTSATVAEGR
jgi:hypothetical protein